jgi:hypothetical protein
MAQCKDRTYSLLNSSFLFKEHLNITSLPGIRETGLGFSHSVNLEVNGPFDSNHQGRHRSPISAGQVSRS